MFGDNPLEEIPDSEKSRGFLYKSVPEKWLIAFAGPFMNLIFAVLIFLVLAVIGLDSYPSQLGDIRLNSEAYTAGFRSGDRILSVNGESISYSEELSHIIQNKIAEKLVFKIQSHENEIKTLSVITGFAESIDPLVWKKFIGLY